MKIISIIIAFISIAQAYTTSDTCMEKTPVTNGPVNAIVSHNGTTYIAGSFTQIGSYTGNGVSINSLTGMVDKTFPKINGFVHASCSDGSGGWYIGGKFTHVGDIARRNLVHILPNGSVNPIWDPSPSADVYAIEVNGDVVYVGGKFTFIGGKSQRYIAAFDKGSGNILDWNPKATGNSGSKVNAIAVDGKNIYVGGTDITYDGAARSMIACLDSATATLLDWNPNSGNYNTGSVNDIALYSGSVYIGGEFSRLGSQYVNSFAALDSASGDILSLNLDFGSRDIINSLVMQGTTLYLGGRFSIYGDKTRRNFAAFDVVANDLTDLKADANSAYPVYNETYINTIGAIGSTLFIGGKFDSLGGQYRNNIAALDAQTGEVQDWNPKANFPVQTIAGFQSSVFAGGNFTSVGGKIRLNIAAFDESTGEVLDWAPNILMSSSNSPYKVYTLTASASTLYIGGYFGNVGGQTRSNFAAVDLITGITTDWNPSALTSRQTNYTPNSLLFSENKVYAVGDFKHIGGETRNYIAALDTLTGKALPWDPNADKPIHTIATNGATVYVGGEFTNIGGEMRRYVAALDTVTGRALKWNPDPDHYVKAIALKDSIVLAGGNFSTIGGESRNRIASLDTINGNAFLWNPNSNGEVNNLTRSGNTLFMGGNFTSIGGASRKYCAAIDIHSGLISSWNPGFNSKLNCIALSDTAVYIGSNTIDIPHGPYMHSFVGSFCLAPELMSINPDTALINDSMVICTLSCLYFHPGATVKLSRNDNADIPGQNVSVLSQTMITCTFDLRNSEPGAWDVVVTNIDERGDSLIDGFTIIAPTQMSADNKTKNLNLKISKNANCISYSIPKRGRTTLHIYSMNGQLLSKPVNSILNPGDYFINLNKKVFSSGMYIVVLESGDKIKKMPLLLMK